METGKTEKANKYYQQALILAREIQDRHSEANILGNIGGVFTELGNVSRFS